LFQLRNFESFVCSSVSDFELHLYVGQMAPLSSSSYSKLLTVNPAELRHTFGMKRLRGWGFCSADLSYDSEFGILFLQ